MMQILALSALLPFKTGLEWMHGKIYVARAEQKLQSQYLLKREEAL
jgi:hypothetical protein